MFDEIKGLRRRLDRLSGEKDAAEKRLQRAQEAVVAHKAELEACMQAQDILQVVARQTQEEFRFYVSEIVSLALHATDFGYEFDIEFVLRRNKTEADIRFISHHTGSATFPIDSSGGGAIDVASFALRLALWSLAPNRTRPVIVLDEPFRFLDRERQGRAAEMLKELSNKLGIQIIMVSHSERFIDSADRAFKITKKSGITRVERE
jgi:chromosome segregation ATPase